MGLCEIQRPPFKLAFCTQLKEFCRIVGAGLGVYYVVDVTKLSTKVSLVWPGRDHVSLLDQTIVVDSRECNQAFRLAGTSHYDRFPATSTKRKALHYDGLIRTLSPCIYPTAYIFHVTMVSESLFVACFDFVCFQQCFSSFKLLLFFLLVF